MVAKSRLHRAVSVAGAAFLAGAGGLALEALLVRLSGLTLGHGRAAPVGIAIYLAAWSLGAFYAGSRRGSERPLWLTAAFLLALAGALAPSAFAASTSGTLAWLTTLAALAGVAFPMGFFLPLLARRWPLGASGDLGWLFGASLAGAAAGAWGLADWLAARAGSRLALAAAAGAALVVAVGGALTVRRAPAESAATDPELAAPSSPPAPGVTPRAAGLVLAAVTGWVGTLEWFAVRLGLLWFGGRQATLAHVLVASMVALAVGAALLPRLLPRGRRGLALLALLSCAGSATLFFLPQTLAGSEARPLGLRSLLLVGPALLPFGAWVPLLHRELGGESGRRLGRLLGWEALGAAIGLPLSHLLLLPTLGMHGTLLAWMLAGAGLALVLAAGRARLVVLAGAAVVALLVWPRAGRSPVLASPPLDRARFELLDFDEGPHFAVSAVRDGLSGETTLMTDGFRAAASGRDYDYMRALGHLPLLMHTEPRRVGVLAFGTGTTAAAVAMHAEVESLEVLELSERVIAFAPHFAEVNRGVLDDPRVTLTLGDGRHWLGRRVGAYDVLTMEPLLPDSPFGVYLYTREFYERARASLRPGGLLCQWVPPHALEPEVFEAVVGTFCAAFPWSSVWLFGTQVILLGGERAPRPRLGAFPAAESELGAALAYLGLERPAGLLARYVADGAALPRPPRPLSDLDPWVIHRPSRPGALAIGDLPRNLASLRRIGGEIPPEWRVGLGAGAEERLRCLALVRAGREAFAVEEARALGVELADPDLATGLEDLLEEAARLAPNEPGLLRLEAEVAFARDLRRAKLLLAADRSQEGSAAAATLLTRAVALRPERAELHAYLALALERLGSERAADARARALELCPRLDETRVGEQLRAWEP